MGQNKHPQDPNSAPSRRQVIYRQGWDRDLRDRQERRDRRNSKRDLRSYDPAAEEEAA